MPIQFIEQNKSELFIALIATALLVILLNIPDHIVLPLFIFSIISSLVASKIIQGRKYDNPSLTQFLAVIVIGLFIINSGMFGIPGEQSFVGGITKIAKAPLKSLDDLVSKLWKAPVKVAKTTAKTGAAKNVDNILIAASKAMLGKTRGATVAGKLSFLTILAAGVLIINPLMAAIAWILGILFIGIPVGSLLSVIGQNFMPILIIVAIVIAILAILKRPPTRVVRA